MQRNDKNVFCAVREKNNILKNTTPLQMWYFLFYANKYRS